ncbi:hypothetical protein [Virgibacillus sp. Bac332]|uniref:hypothetical protein n=1 Tax=Virgibacillus sp. Bac332 TaxID=2419842 RepID=UPI000EF526F1|nr:hypothetical protein [Virgibacillus sp. Bac332]
MNADSRDIWDTFRFPIIVGIVAIIGGYYIDQNIAAIYDSSRPIFYSVIGYLLLDFGSFAYHLVLEPLTTSWLAFLKVVGWSRDFLF